MEQTKGQIRFFGCGGTGVKLGDRFDNLEPDDRLADIKVCYLDTSTSDLPKDVNPLQCFITEGTDGSGSKRSSNAHIITSNAMRQVLTKFPPEDLNIVGFSGIGGSGSLMGPVTVRDLLERGAPVIAIVVVGTSSIRSIMNCLDTLKTLAAQSALAKKPLTVLLFNNGANDRIDEVDDAVERSVQALRILASRRHVGLDRSDIANMLDYTQVTSVAPQLATMTITSSEEELREVPYPVAITTLYSESTKSGELGSDHYSSARLSEPYNDVDELHFAVSVSQLNKVVKMLEDELAKLRQKNGARVDTGSSLLDKAECSDDGLFFS